MNRLTVLQRQQQLAVRALLLRQLVALWPTLQPGRLERTFPAWLTAAGALTQQGRAASAAVAAAYLRELRRAEGVPGRADIALSATLPAEQVATALRVTSLVAIRRALGAGKTLDQALQVGFVMSSGAVSRLALDGGRQTVVDTVRQDPKARGWQRITSGSACDFCQMLADRGGVYASDTADFEAHDHCACVAEPVWVRAAA